MGDIDAEVPVREFELRNPTDYQLVGEFKVFIAHKGDDEYYYKVENRQSGAEMYPEYRISCLMSHPSVSQVLHRDANTYGKNLFVFRKYPSTLHPLGARPYLEFSTIQKYMTQLMAGLYHIHGFKFVHCALQPENIMIDDTTGGEPQLKIFNFAHAQPFDKPNKETHLPTDYQPFEILLDRESPNEAIDMWSAGCIMAEMIRRCKLFRGDQLETVMENMVKVLGPPNGRDRILLGTRNVTIPDVVDDRLERAFPGASRQATDLIMNLLTYDPTQRLNALTARQHAYFSHDETYGRGDLTIPNFP